MTNKPKVELAEKDHSQTLEERIQAAWDSMFDGEDRAFTEAMFKSLDYANLPHRPGTPILLISTPTSPDKSIFNRRFRDVFPGHFIVDEAHKPYKPLDRSHLHQHQIEAMRWLDDHPLMQAELNTFGGISFVTEMQHQPFNIGHTPMALRSLRKGIRPWTEEVRFPYIGYTGFEDQFESAHDSVFIEDRYVAPPKKRKSWDKDAEFWYKSGMSGKHTTNLALAAYRASKKNIYNPEFNWQDQHEARRKLHYIKHVNVGTAGHIDYGNNRIRHPRPYWPGYLAECIRTAIKSL